MKTILCFGDSNTWGYNPSNQQRFGQDVRWTGVLQNKLGVGFRIIEEGLNGRTTVWDDPIEGFKNGMNYLIPCMESHKPFDLITITQTYKRAFNWIHYVILIYTIFRKSQLDYSAG